MLVAFVLKKSNERISYLVAVHRFTFVVLVCQFLGMVGEVLGNSGSSARRNIVFKIYGIRSLEARVELYLSRHGQSTFNDSLGFKLQIINSASNIRYRLVFSYLTLLPSRS